MNTSTKIKTFIVDFLKKNMGLCFVAIITFIISSILNVVPAKIYQVMIDEGFTKKSLYVVLISSVMLLVTYLFKVSMNYISNHKLLIMGNKITSELKDIVFERLFSLELDFLSNYDTGYISSRLEEVSKIDSIFSNVSINFVASVTECIISIIFIATLSKNFVIILLLPVPIMIFLMYKMAKNLNNLFVQNVESGANYLGKMNETINGIESIKSLGNEKETKKKMIHYKDENLKNAKIQAIGLNKFSSVLGVVGNIISVFIYLVGGILIIYDDLSIGAFIAISMYANKIYSPIISFSGVYMIWCPAIIGLKRVSDFFFNEQNVLEEEKIKNVSSVEKIDFSNVSMSFGDKNVFNDVNISICKGDKIQINGVNGSGKSTLIKLLLKNIRPTHGCIKINGLNYDCISKSSVLSKIAYVPQKQFVFNETVMNNITLGLINYDKIMLEKLIKEFGLEKIIDYSNGKGLGEIGEQGKKISGGEIQKISICRAILRDKEILIFDEATNNLDDKSIAYIKDYIKNSNKTWIIIDHQNDFSDLGFKQVYI